MVSAADWQPVMMTDLYNVTAQSDKTALNADKMLTQCPSLTTVCHIISDLASHKHPATHMN